ncbi:hypothetical protein [Candidatus Nitrotoga sp. M5]|uniref:hypothetical protein n=1 Tax=Candidatus Nitrotoga sp. M5 TaxID=2890409 RepID=UPI001EF5F0B0|nr:hypothetical protein [Candidatus Nitrotoga sp. M5]
MLASAGPASAQAVWLIQMQIAARLNLFLVDGDDKSTYYRLDKVEIMNGKNGKNNLVFLNLSTMTKAMARAASNKLMAVDCSPSL